MESDCLFSAQVGPHGRIEAMKENSFKEWPTYHIMLKFWGKTAGGWDFDDTYRLRITRQEMGRSGWKLGFFKCASCYTYESFDEQKTHTFLSAETLTGNRKEVIDLCPTCATNVWGAYAVLMKDATLALSWLARSGAVTSAIWDEHREDLKAFNRAYRHPQLQLAIHSQCPMN
jgi:hypothetical protein